MRVRIRIKKPFDFHKIVETGVDDDGTFYYVIPNVEAIQIT